MKIVKWAAVVLTVLFAVLNLGTAPDPSQEAAFRILGAVLGVAGVAAAVGLAANRPWGRAAVITVGVLNLVAAVGSLFVDSGGMSTGASVTGIVLGALCVATGALVPSSGSERRVAV
jgi:peptidoglycan/LPS O-acetylase OafA/YrhL